MLAELIVGADPSGTPITYRVTAMPTRVQFHVARRLAPVMVAMGAAAGGIAALADARPGGGGTSEGDAQPGNADSLAAIGDMLTSLEPIIEAVGRLDDATTDYVLEACLSAVQRQDGSRWLPVWNARNKAPQYDDITLPVMLQLTASVLRENVAGFFPAAALASK